MRVRCGPQWKVGVENRHDLLDHLAVAILEGCPVKPAEVVTAERVFEIVEQTLVAVGAFLLRAVCLGEDLRQIIVSDPRTGHGDAVACFRADGLGDLVGMLEPPGTQHLDIGIDLADRLGNGPGIIEIDVLDHLAPAAAPERLEGAPEHRIGKDRIVHRRPRALREHAVIPAVKVHQRQVAGRIARMRKGRSA